LMSEMCGQVLMDGRGVGDVGDGGIVSSMGEGVILVVQGGKSTRAITQRARHELQRVGAKIYGVVLNNVDMRREGYDYYYYNRYYSNYGQDGADATTE